MHDICSVLSFSKDRGTDRGLSFDASLGKLPKESIVCVRSMGRNVPHLSLPKRGGLVPPYLSFRSAFSGTRTRKTALQRTHFLSGGNRPASQQKRRLP